MFSPLYKTSPESDFSKPDKIFNNVDFPDPDAPNITTKSFSSTLRLIPLKTS